nr:hypothetical protein [Klebsiella pneumoniae]
MITNKQILTEVEQLSRLFKDGEADIPSMWNCFWPGLAAMFWLLLWPIAMFSYKLFFVELPNAAQMGIAASVLVAFVAGLFMMLYIVNFRALYLSIPDTYRKQSALCQFIVGKAKEGANKQVISSQADSLIKISRIWADFFPANTSNQPI